MLPLLLQHPAAKLVEVWQKYFDLAGLIMVGMALGITTTMIVGPVAVTKADDKTCQRTYGVGWDHRIKEIPGPSNNYAICKNIYSNKEKPVPSN